jgi:hypothetical protein
MKIITSSILLNALLAWRSDLELGTSVYKGKRAINYGMFFKSNSGGAITLFCKPKPGVNVFSCTEGKSTSTKEDTGLRI